MNELAETPNLATAYCPGCGPERDPIAEVLAVHWCEAHRPRIGGSDDGRTTVTNDALMSSSGEVEAATNRRWCDLVHRALKRG